MVLVFVCVHMLSLSCVQLFAAAWTVAHQVLLPMEFFKQEYWCGVCYHFLLQGFFPIQGLNLRLLHWQADSLPLNHLGSPQRKTSPNLKAVGSHVATADIYT